MEPCDCKTCDYYGCDCVVTGNHDNCNCTQCSGKPTEDNYGS